MARATTSSLKLPQIFDRAAAAADQQHVALRPGVEAVVIACAIFSAAHWPCTGAGYRISARAGAPPQRRQHVAQRRRLRAGDDADRAREQRQGAFAVLVEQALRGQLFLQPLERFEQRADAGAAIASTLIW